MKSEPKKSEKIPSRVLKAIDTIAGFVRERGMKHVVVGRSGSPAFCFTTSADNMAPYLDAGSKPSTGERRLKQIFKPHEAANVTDRRS
jgi:hypothetical protein